MVMAMTLYATGTRVTGTATTTVTERETLRETRRVADRRSSDLGSKTPYHSQGAAASYSTPPESCSAQPIALNILARHGARHTGHIKDINDLAAHFASSSSAPGWLENYTYPAVDGLDDGNLVALGAQEHSGLATRLRQAFPAAFPSSADGPYKYNPATIKLSSTVVPRTGQSATSFAYAALADNNGPLDGGVFTPPFVNVASACMDTKLRFHEACPAYTREVTNNASATSEATAYLEGDEMRAAVESLAARVGLSAAEVTADQLLTAFEACAYDIILDGGNQEQWCQLFDDGAWTAANYASDLEMWYKFGGGNAINGEMPMMLLRDFFAAFDDAVSANEDSSASGPPLTAAWRFAHAETVVPFATMLGLYAEQEEMTAATRDDGRYFRSSLRVTFAANVVATLYACTSNASDTPQKYSYKVRFLYNEQEVTIPACADQGQSAFCDLETVRAAFAAPLDEWEYGEVCDGTCTCEW